MPLIREQASDQRHACNPQTDPHTVLERRSERQSDEILLKQWEGVHHSRIRLDLREQLGGDVAGQSGLELTVEDGVGSRYAQRAAEYAGV